MKNGDENEVVRRDVRNKSESNNGTLLLNRLACDEKKAGHESSPSSPNSWRRDSKKELEFFAETRGKFRSFGRVFLIKPFKFLA